MTSGGRGWERGKGRRPREREGRKRKDFGEPESGESRAEKSGIGAFRSTRDGNNVRGIEGVKVEGATQTSKGGLDVGFNGRFVRSGRI